MCIMCERSGRHDDGEAGENSQLGNNFRLCIYFVKKSLLTMALVLDNDGYNKVGKLSK